MPARDDVNDGVFYHACHPGAGVAGPDLAGDLRAAMDMGPLYSGLAPLRSGFLLHCYRACRSPYAESSARDTGGGDTRMKTEQKVQHSSLAEVATLFLRLGFTAFGVPPPILR